MCESEQIRSDRSASQTVRNRWKREQEERKSNEMILEKKKVSVRDDGRESGRWRRRPEDRRRGVEHAG